jgi:3-hydroxyisobutyrate dehydrogenase-like beta-hydroxyacid dehydrogenase
MSVSKVGFIGLGNIGAPMAVNLVESGLAVQVFDINAAAVAGLVQAGAQAASSPAQLASGCEVICLCVRDDDDVERVLAGPDGIFQQAAAGLHIVIHSTVTLGALRDWVARGAALGIVVVDAAITGGAAAVERKQLCYIVGGDEATLRYLQPVFDASASAGGEVVAAGPVGAGLTLKLCNNAMACFAFVAIHEAVKLAEAGGCSLDKLYQVGEANGVITPQMRRFIETRQQLSAEFSVAGFKQRYLPFATLVEKDLRYALRCAEELAVSMPSTGHVESVIKQVFLDER